jgi:biotin synthase
VAGGREHNLRSLQPLALYPADSIFVNGYLTTPGQPAPEVWGMIEDLGFKIEVDYQQAPEKAPQLRSQSRESLNVLQ